MTVYIAYKRAKNTLLYSEIKNQMPADYIMEYFDTSKFPRGYFKTSDGWEIDNEDFFKLELAKNPDVINNFRKQQHEMSIEQKRILKDQVMKEYLGNKEEYKLYLEFLEWKKKMRHQGYLKQIDRNY